MRDLLQQALGALLDIHLECRSPEQNSTITALRTALAAPQSEPVAWLKTMYSGNRPMLEVDHSKPPKADSIPVYAAPPAAPAPAVPEGEIVITKDEDGVIVSVTRQNEEGRILSVIAESAAPAVPLTREQQIALREAHCNTASDEYFGARPQVDDATKRRIYEAGFKEGWESGIGGGVK